MKNLIFIILIFLLFALIFLINTRTLTKIALYKHSQQKTTKKFFKLKIEKPDNETITITQKRQRH